VAIAAGGKRSQIASAGVNSLRAPALNKKSTAKEGGPAEKKKPAKLTEKGSASLRPLSGRAGRAKGLSEYRSPGKGSEQIAKI